MAADALFQALWDSYVKHAPHALRVHGLLEELGETPVNDHIALRTFGLPGMQIEDLARAFVDAGYERVAPYAFEKKQLDAWHYADPQGGPKVFISALRVHSLSEGAQDVVRSLAGQVAADAAADPRFTNSGRPWRVDRATYEMLREESEYAAWVAAFGFRANHFTLLVNALRGFGSLEMLNERLVEAGFTFSESGGRIKGTAAQGLEQSSTRAEDVEVAFDDGALTIPGSYYEFALRYVRDGVLFDGFIAESADRIFESTDTSQ
ncbi:MAG: DUF1338 domain-containing protein [Myxococcota bacterium]